MSFGEEALRAVEGVGRLARFDREGCRDFGRDVAAAARSFWAYAFALPAILLLIALDALATAPKDPGWVAAADAIGYVIQVAGFLLLLRPILAAYGRADRWVWFVTAYNWYNALSTLLLVMAISLAAGPLAALGAWPSWGAEIYAWVIEAFLAQALLEVGAWPAIGIVLADVLLGVAVGHLGHLIATGSAG